MAPTRASIKRTAEGIEDDDVTAPKKDKQTPSKKTPKVVQMKNGTSPKSPLAVAASPASAKKVAKKTPLKAKTPSASDAPSTPKGKLSEPSPLQTRSARKKKAELNATIGTPSKGVTPSKQVPAKKLNTSTKAATPKATTPKAGAPKKQTPASKTKGKKVVDDDDEDEDDLKLAFDDEMDSDDLDSDDELDEEDEVSDDDDFGSDEDLESEEDEIEAEKRKAELEAILKKPANRKSILKGQKIDSPAPVKQEPGVKTPAKGQANTPAKKSTNLTAAVKQEAVEDVKKAPEPTPVVEKTPVKGQGKTPNKNATSTPAIMKQEAVEEAKKKTPVKGPATPAQNTKSAIVKQETVEEAKKKTPAKGPATPAQNTKSPVTGKQGAVEEVKAADKTPAKAVKGEKTPVAKTPIAAAVAPSPKAAQSPAKGSQQSPATPKRMKASDFFDLEAEDESTTKKKVKGANTPSAVPAKEILAKEAPVKTTPAKKPKKAAQTPEQKGQSPVDTTQESDAPVPSVDAKAAENDKATSKGENKKAKSKAKKAAKKAAKQAETDITSAMKKTKPDSKALKEFAEKVKTKTKEGDATWYPKETQFIAEANEARFKAIREKLLAAGKNEEQIAEELPRIQKSMLKRLSHTRCLRCRKRGHMQKDCPQSRVPVKCYKCGVTSHTAKACSIKEQVYNFADCYICHQTGHLTRSCPSNANGIYPRGGSCFKCNEKTHLAKDCPNAKPKDENTKPEKLVPTVGILDAKQSADADVTMDTSMTKNKAKQGGGKKKAVVKF